MNEREQAIDRIAEAMQTAYEDTHDDLWTAHDPYTVMAEAAFDTICEIWGPTF